MLWIEHTHANTYSKRGMDVGGNHSLAAKRDAYRSGGRWLWSG